MILLPAPRFKVQIFKRNKIWQTVPGAFSKREDAERYGNKFYPKGEALDPSAPQINQFRIVEGANIPKRQKA